MTLKLNNGKFQSYFSAVYGERWPSLLNALLSSESQILRKNIFSDSNFDVSQFLALPHFNSYAVNSEINVHNLCDKNDIQVFYKMDLASCIVASALDVQIDDVVLDMCAAPGGKSLMLAEKLNGTGQLVANEYSSSRRERLTRVIREYLPYEKRQNIFVHGKDGNNYGLSKPNVFHRILADVPCSGERHLLGNPQELLQWTKRRSENLSVRQYSLLSSAYLSCQSGGCIVYSTCSISPLENDEVVKKLIKKRQIKILEYSEAARFSFLERTEFGYQILPDASEGFGPMYFSIIHKI